MISWGEKKEDKNNARRTFPISTTICKLFVYFNLKNYYFFQTTRKLVKMWLIGFRHKQADIVRIFIVNLYNAINQ